jgi:DNA-binding ferritin-like protein
MKRVVLAFVAILVISPTAEAQQLQQIQLSPAEFALQLQQAIGQMAQIAEGYKRTAEAAQHQVDQLTKQLADERAKNQPKDQPAHSPP